MTETMTTTGQLAIALAVGSTDTALDRCMKRASNSFIDFLYNCVQSTTVAALLEEAESAFAVSNGVETIPPQFRGACRLQLLGVNFHLPAAAIQRHVYHSQSFVEKIPPHKSVARAARQPSSRLQIPPTGGGVKGSLLPRSR